MNFDFSLLNRLSMYVVPVVYTMTGHGVVHSALQCNILVS